MKKIILLFTFVYCSFISIGQIVPSEVPYYTSGSGTGISPKDSLFLLNIRFRLQNRLEYTKSTYERENSDLSVGLERLRLRFDGFFYTTNLVYIVQLAFAESEIETSSSSPPRIIKDAVIFYRFNKHFSLGIGLTNLPRNRQSVISSGDLEFVDRSLIHSTFGIGRDYGVQAYYYNNIDQVYYAIRGALTTGIGNNLLEEKSGVSYTGKFEVLPFGKFQNNGDYFEGDLEREKKPKVSIGLAYNFISNTVNAGAPSGSLSESTDLSTFMVDYILKYKGLSLSLEYVMRNADKSVLTETEEKEVRYMFVGSALNTQLGYVFKNNYGASIRYTTINPNEDITSVTRPVKEYTLGLSKYIRGHRLKIQTDISRQVDEARLIENKNPEKSWKIRLQLEMGI